VKSTVCDMTTTANTRNSVDRTDTRRPFVVGVALAATLIISSLFASADSVTSAVATEPSETISWLLDGRAFEQALNEAIESFTNGAALLDPFEFEKAVTQALAAEAN